MEKIENLNVCESEKLSQERDVIMGHYAMLA